MDLKANAVRDFQGLDKSEEDCRLSKKERNGTCSKYKYALITKRR